MAEAPAYKKNAVIWALISNRGGLAKILVMGIAVFRLTCPNSRAQQFESVRVSILPPDHPMPLECGTVVFQASKPTLTITDGAKVIQ